MQLPQPIVLRQRRDFGQAISDSLAFIRQNWRPLLRAMATVGILPFLFALILIAAVAFAGATGGDPEFAPFMVGLGFVIAIPFMLFAGVMVEAVTHEYVAAYARNEHIGLTNRDLVRRCLSRFWTYFGIMFLNGLATLVGALLCYLPGIWINTSFTMALMVHAEERLGASDSLSRSYKLVNRKWWATFALQLVMGMVLGVVMMVLIIPFYIVGMVLMATSISDPGATPSVAGLVVLGIGYVLLILASFLLSPVIRVCIGMWYYGLVEELEGPGLRERLQGFETT